jgi:hypothetical protein
MSTDGEDPRDDPRYDPTRDAPRATENGEAEDADEATAFAEDMVRTGVVDSAGHYDAVVMPREGDVAAFTGRRRLGSLNRDSLMRSLLPPIPINDDHNGWRWNWMARLQEGEEILLVKNSVTAHVAAPWLAPQPGSVGGSLFIRHHGGQIAHWYVREDGTGFDHKPLVRPLASPHELLGRVAGLSRPADVINSFVRRISALEDAHNRNHHELARLRAEVGQLTAVVASARAVFTHMIETYKPPVVTTGEDRRAVDIDAPPET